MSGDIRGQGGDNTRTSGDTWGHAGTSGDTMVTSRGHHGGHRDTTRTRMGQSWGPPPHFPSPAPSPRPCPTPSPPHLTQPPPPAPPLPGGPAPFLSPAPSPRPRPRPRPLTPEEQVPLGQLQLVPEGDARVLQPGAGLELHPHLQLWGGGGQGTRGGDGWRGHPPTPLPKPHPLPRSYLLVGPVVVGGVSARLAQGDGADPVGCWGGGGRWGQVTSRAWGATATSRCGGPTPPHGGPGDVLQGVLMGSP